MPKRTHQIDQLIVNSPFAEPEKHWDYDRESQLFTLEDGRRKAGYVVSTPGSRSFDDPGVFIELPLVNQIRTRVKAWREERYPGATGITTRLLEHWYDQEQRDSGKRIFFCGLEAIETLMWLTEAPPAAKQGIDIPGDGGPFVRWCTKLATGGGKTNVMAMLIAWQTLNKVTYPQDKRFGKHVLVIAPGLTVRSRLEVLQPDGPGNFYDEFHLIPTSLREPFRQGKVKVINWHKLNWETDEQIEKRKSVVKLGAKSDEAYVRDVLQEMASARNILVINDEAHHAWRLKPGEHVAGVSREDRDEATKWIGGLDRIHRARGIMKCFDFSATPYIPAGDKSPEGMLFEWIVSDFGLNDAIEAGLVKTPRIVVRDDAIPDTKTFKSKLYHLYNDPDVKDDLNRKAEPGESLPDLVSVAYYLLGVDWLAARQWWEHVGMKTPPVMITVANRTETAARIKYAFDHAKIRIAELCNPEKTLHIDSKVLDKAEAMDDSALVENEVDSTDDHEADDRPEKKLTKDQQAKLLRQTVDTVGRVGKPGEQMQHIISVAMLSEGWDAKTVTHIMGLRAFTSQLLCEQVVGRGLRRTSYEFYQNDEGVELFQPEYVNIFGVPFTFLPHEGTDEGPPPPPQPKTRVEPLPDREAELAIQWPNVIRIEHEFRPRLTLDLDKVDKLTINASDTPTMAQLGMVIAGKPDLTTLTDIELEELGRQNRLQKIIFEVSRDIFDQMSPKWPGNKQSLITQVIGLVEKYMRSDRIVIEPRLFRQAENKRRILLTLNMNRIVQHIWSEIRFDEENTTRLVPVFDRVKPLVCTGDMQPWYTGRPCHPTDRSHISHAVFDSTWESCEAFHLDHSEHVHSWVKNDHLGFEILYTYRGAIRKYRPDFLIRLNSGTTLVLEVKGQDSAENQAKRDYLDEWVRAVNSHGGFGTWTWDVSLAVDDLQRILDKHTGAVVLG